MANTYKVAQTINEVVDAWKLVHSVYLKHRLIESNPANIHTVPQAILNDSIVVTAGTPARPACTTMSAYHDHEDHGLPLDAVYRDELNKLRDSGRHLMEIGLFADARQTPSRSAGALLDLMRWTTWFGVLGGVTDAVIGVHPRHVAFYRRVMGFEPAGPARSYSLVNGAPVVLLRLDWVARSSEAATVGPRGLSWIVQNPLTASDFAKRCRRLPQAHANSPIARFLRHHEQMDYGQWQMDYRPESVEACAA